ncbi:hypothetical protein DVJ83_12450 [Deinococcus wulumuqiensis]|uniref:Uncharacterized protein n=1 Tax=Deinococcus wulumuqiensis TaxID=980427 RepID=A0A345IJC3_9DEIO|nr:hypothetical protein [Deinococcus wulumuqiensis]AXG99795.1 hypothetical protein DVJ83_12450 [Deinococcus wulumuqiensis]
MSATLIGAGLDPRAVHERLGMEAYSDHEVGVMVEVLQELYAGRELSDLTEAEWLRAYGLMHQRKKTGWMTEGVVSPDAEV